MTERTASKAVTIRDVARAAGVSISTVSRVLDDRHPPSTSPSAERVRAAATELGYRPDAYASGLRRQHSRTVGVLVPRLSDTVMAMFFEEVARACAAQAGFAIVATTEDRPEAERAAAETLLRQRVDGLILTTARLDDPFAAELRTQGVPHVLALRTDHVSPTAAGDDELGGYLATRHLLDLGHRQIALVAGPSYASTAVARQAGYRRAMAEAGLADVEHLIHESTFGMDSGETAARAILTGPDRPTAIFAVNDNTAIGVLAAAQAAGLSVPDDLSVVGYNDIPVSARLPVALTSVRVPFDRIATHAVDLLTQQLAGTLSAEPVTATPTLIPRQSTARPPATPAT
ncbi:LacI family DNA-binding transcriptional regulator [Citricoccus sp.]|uniref:LacI family DNA-binding transcriptional regulator n=1 Tax=Citricoccus sp. TaxID=1978372 RepID=UPI00261BC439|nr:LacI family DNA-binding transcriptional regulator [Citricoccus sp.]HRO95016.1 LacI family DNA-binding transcriptional regulator [Citricoccus sp.]